MNIQTLVSLGVMGGGRGVGTESMCVGTEGMGVVGGGTGVGTEANDVCVCVCVLLTFAAFSAFTSASLASAAFSPAAIFAFAGSPSALFAFAASLACAAFPVPFFAFVAVFTTRE